MSDQKLRGIVRNRRFLWGGAAAILVLILLGTVMLSGSSVQRAERDALVRAQDLSESVVEDQLALGLLARDIVGAGYRDLTVSIQAGILSDDRFALVRIWRVDGALIYSTAPLDDVAGVVARDDPRIDQALGGRTVAVLSSEGTYHEGLTRPDEELYQVFAPIRLSGDSVDGVVEIDQRYAAIRNQAYRFWRPLQIALLALLVALAALFTRAMRSRGPYGEAPLPDRRALPGRRADDITVREAMERAGRAERVARDAEERVRELEAQVADAPSTATATAAVEELDLKLRASEAEREELTDTVRRLQAELAERAAELSAASGAAGSRAETRRANKVIAEAESKVAAAERKATEAEKKTLEASKRASRAAERALEMEAQLREAQERATTAEERASQAEIRAAKAEVAAASSDGRDSDPSLEERAVAAEARLAEVLAELRELEDARAVLDRQQVAVTPDGSTEVITSGVNDALEVRIAELEDARRADVVELQHAQEAFATTQDELANATRKLEEAEARVRELEDPVNDRPPAVDHVAEPPPVSAPAPPSNGDTPVQEAGWGGETALAGPGDTSLTVAAAHVVEPQDDAPLVEGPSLRERLARAAAARRRLS